MEESSIGVWQWFHAHSDTWIMSSCQTRRAQSEGQFGIDIQDPMLLCCSSKQHAGQSVDPVCTMCHDKNAIRDSTSALLEHIMLPRMRMAKWIAS
jgi:hypothetical protein